MSQFETFSSINETSSSSVFDDDVNVNNNNKILSLDTSINSNDDWKSIDDNNDIQDDLTNVNNSWANFATFNNDINPSSETVHVTNEDDWSNFESNDKLTNDDDDTFGDYGEVQTSPSTNSFSTEQIESLLSTCFPLETSILSTDNNNSSIPFELPSFTTFNDKTKQLPCFQHCLSLWNVLSNISNDPLGIKYQWRKSNTEYLFHQALDVHERFHTKNSSSTSESATLEVTPNDNNENKLLSQTVDWKQNDLANPLTDLDNSSLSNNETLDFNSYISPIQISTSNKEDKINSSTKVFFRNDSPTLQQNSTPIKTINLFPGSTTVINDDVKPVIDSVSNFSFMNPKALMSNNNESTTLY